jgi:hypothetical protein
VKKILLFALLSLFPAAASIAKTFPEMSKEPEVPAGLDFIRTVDIEGFVQRLNDRGKGAQSIRLRSRYTDPDVNAFVGLVTGLHHFNQNLRIRELDELRSAGLLWNWGADIGVKHGRHLWEVDLMGAVLNTSLAPAFALVGEHQAGSHWTFFHRTELNAFQGDAIVDADQGVYFMWKWAGLSAGYRIFAAKHMSRHGPHVGFRLLFENPKIPFLFPSLG